ncbi:MAG TPA: hypothetical protein VMJ74_03315 [Pseudomonadales bacterium]|nr:hypothetical protein [Pseudomonadales bacterium]
MTAPRIASQTEWTAARERLLLKEKEATRQEEWEDSPPGWPQSKPYQWWRLHDEY